MANLPTFASLAPVEQCEFSSVVFVERLAWCATSESILVFLERDPIPRVCRTRGFCHEHVADLVAELRGARDSGCPVQLLTRKGWSSGEWFCGIERASESACVEQDAALAVAANCENARWIERIRENVFVMVQNQKRAETLRLLQAICESEDAIKH